METRRVITAFLFREGRVLFLRRSSSVGSYQGRLLALASKADRIPVYCCAETIKVMAYEPEAGIHFPVQKPRPAKEIIKQIPRQVQVLNLYFDLTESKLIAGYLTERGILAGKQLGAASKEMAGIIERNLLR